ncbi:MAG: hypothetical protein KDK89_15815 [Alphaproteobacteria bacterium]|nr:hypothetical protein [Alphaproteobacteria bacterium]
MNKDIDKKIEINIRELYGDDEGAKAFFDWAAARRNDAAETSIDRVSQVANINRQEANRLLRSLSDAGCGEYIIGRKGWKTRIRWAYSLLSLGRAASGENVELQEVDPELEADVTDQVASSPSGDSTAPQRLTIAEAKRGLAEAFGITADKIEIVIRA